MTKPLGPASRVCEWCGARRALADDTLCRACAKIRGPVKRPIRAPSRVGSQWDGKSYGYGAASAHPCVRVTLCGACGAKPGTLCIGAYGPHFGTHVVRRSAYQRGLKNKVLP